MKINLTKSQESVLAFIVSNNGKYDSRTIEKARIRNVEGNPLDHLNPLIKRGLVFYRKHFGRPFHTIHATELGINVNNENNRD